MLCMQLLMVRWLQMIEIKTINDDIMDLLKKLIKYTEDYKIIWDGDYHTNTFTSKEYFTDNLKQSYLFNINKSETKYTLIFTVTNMDYKVVSEKYCIAETTIGNDDVNSLLENLFNLVYDRCHNRNKYNAVCSLINAFKAIDKTNDEG